MQAASSDDQPITAINITPLVDVALVLVIIFMITMPFLLERALKVAASDARVVPVGAAKDPILIEIKARGVAIEGSPTPLQDLPAALGRLLRDRGMAAVAVSAEPEIPHGRVVEVLDLALEAGAADLDLLEPTQAIPAPAPPGGGAKIEPSGAAMPLTFAIEPNAHGRMP